MCLGFKPGATGRYVVIDKTTELWRPPNLHSLWFNICIPTQSHWSHLGFDLLYLWLAAFTVYKCSKKISDDWIRTLEQNRKPWHNKCPTWHNKCPTWPNNATKNKIQFRQIKFGVFAQEPAQSFGHLLSLIKRLYRGIVLKELPTSAYKIVPDFQQRTIFNKLKRLKEHY